MFSKNIWSNIYGEEKLQLWTFVGFLSHSSSIISPLFVFEAARTIEKEGIGTLMELKFPRDLRIFRLYLWLSEPLPMHAMNELNYNLCWWCRVRSRDNENKRNSCPARSAQKSRVGNWARISTSTLEVIECQSSSLTKSRRDDIDDAIQELCNHWNPASFNLRTIIHWIITHASFLSRVILAEIDEAWNFSLFNRELQKVTWYFVYYLFLDGQDRQQETEMKYEVVVVKSEGGRVF